MDHLISAADWLQWGLCGLKYSVCKFFRTQASIGECECAMHSLSWCEIIKSYCREELAGCYNDVAFTPPYLSPVLTYLSTLDLASSFSEREEERQNAAFILPLQLPSCFRDWRLLIFVFLLTLNLFWWPHIIQSPDLSVPFPLTIPPCIKIT